MPKTYDIAIVGAGIVGATAACLFTQAGFKTALIDAKPFNQWTSGKAPGRVVALNQSAERILSHIKVWPDVAKHSQAFTRIHVWEDNDSAEITFNSIDTGYQHFAHIVENDLLVDRLIAILKQNYFCDLFPEQAITALDNSHSDYALLELANGELLHAECVIGADGANSVIRSLLDINIQAHDFSQHAIVANIATHSALTTVEPKTAWQVFLPTGPLALLPTGDLQYSIVWSLDEEQHEQIKAMDDNAFNLALNNAVAKKITSVTSSDHAQPDMEAIQFKVLGTRHSFPIKQHQVERYIDPRVALIGDAAHTVHPLAGLGANLGLLDAAALAELMIGAKQQNKPFYSKRVLSQYERWRKSENQLALTLMKQLHTIFHSQQTSITSLRRIGLSVSNQSSVLKQIFSDYAMGNRGDLPKLAKAKH